MGGGLVVLGLFVLLFIYGFAIALRSRNHFGRLLAIGLTANLFFYVFINTEMVMGLIPVVGIPLPLISYGGTAMMTVLVGRSEAQSSELQSLMRFWYAVF